MAANGRARLLGNPKACLSEGAYNAAVGTTGGPPPSPDDPLPQPDDPSWRHGPKGSKTEKRAPVERQAGADDSPPSTRNVKDRLAAAHVDLLAVIDSGIPERAWLPASERMLARGARHHVAAPLKSGKSIAFLAHAVDMGIAGASVSILDRENGANEYARRLRDILADRPAGATDAVRKRLRYYAFPEIRMTDGGGIAAALKDSDVVIFDSTRTFLSALSLGEDSSDDFARFASALIDPLFRAGIATVQLDNAGHNDAGRARGSSSKGDLADVAFSLKSTISFDATRRGQVRLRCQAARFGDVAAEFTMDLGAGHFGTFVLEDREASALLQPSAGLDLREEILSAIECEPGINTRDLRAKLPGRNGEKDAVVKALHAEGQVHIHPEGRTRRHYLPDTTVPVCPTVPDRAPGTRTSDRAHVPPPKGAPGTGGVTSSAGNALPLFTDEGSA